FSSRRRHTRCLSDWSSDVCSSDLGVARYEMLIERLPPDGDEVLVMAIPLTEVQDTLNYLLTLEAIIGGAVLLGMVGLAWWIIRVGLRPLEHIGETAQAIAHGDLSRRVQPATP